MNRIYTRRLLTVLYILAAPEDTSICRQAENVFNSTICNQDRSLGLLKAILWMFIAFGISLAIAQLD
jgi:hypothetical protein